MISNQWYCVLSSKQLKKNQVLAVKRLGKQIAFWRDSKNIVHATEDRCCHRGVSLGAGKVVNDHIQCPFHGLEYDGSGRCVLIPADGKNAAISARFQVEGYLIKEAYDLIWLWNGKKEKASQEIPFFRELQERHFTYSETLDYWNTFYTRAIENQLDVVHLPFVHHNTIGRGNKTLVHGPAFEWRQEQLFTQAFNEVDTGQGQIPTMELKVEGSIYLQFRYPNIWMNHIADKIRIVIAFVPVDEKNTVMIIRYYHLLTRIPIIKDFIGWTGKISSILIERQDKRVVETQEPKISEWKSDEKLLKGDRPIIEFRKMRDQLKADAEKDQED